MIPRNTLAQKLEDNGTVTITFSDYEFSPEEVEEIANEMLDEFNDYFEFMGGYATRATVCFEGDKVIFEAVYSTEE